MLGFKKMRILARLFVFVFAYVFISSRLFCATTNLNTQILTLSTEDRCNLLFNFADPLMSELVRVDDRLMRKWVESHDKEDLRLAQFFAKQIKVFKLSEIKLYLGYAASKFLEKNPGPNILIVGSKANSTRYFTAFLMQEKKFKLSNTVIYDENSELEYIEAKLKEDTLSKIVLVDDVLYSGRQVTSRIDTLRDRLQKSTGTVIPLEKFSIIVGISHINDLIIEGSSVDLRYGLYRPNFKLLLEMAASLFGVSPAHKHISMEEGVGKTGLTLIDYKVPDEFSFPDGFYFGYRLNDFFPENPRWIKTINRFIKQDIGIPYRHYHK